MRPYQIYRHTTLGISLQESLDELVLNGKLNRDMADKILLQYDEAISEALETRVNLSLTFSAKLHTYRYYDHVWTLILKNVKFIRQGNVYFTVNRIKIVACAAERALKEDENLFSRKRKRSLADGEEEEDREGVVRIGCSTLSVR